MRLKFVNIAVVLISHLILFAKMYFPILLTTVISQDFSILLYVILSNSNAFSNYTEIM